MMNRNERDELHRIIDSIPKHKLPKISEWLKRIYDEDDMELSDQTIREIEEGRKQIKDGEYVTLDELLRDADINV